MTGFSDGESSFHVTVCTNKAYKTGWSIVPMYAIELHKKDLAVLLKIQRLFGDIRKIYHLKKKGHVVYNVTSVKDLHNVIISHL